MLIPQSQINKENIVHIKSNKSKLSQKEKDENNKRLKTLLKRQICCNDLLKKEYKVLSNNQRKLLYLLDKKDSEIKQKGKQIKMLKKFNDIDTLDLQASLLKIVKAMKTKQLKQTFLFFTKWRDFKNNENSKIQKKELDNTINFQKLISNYKQLKCDQQQNIQLLKLQGQLKQKDKEVKKYKKFSNNLKGSLLLKNKVVKNQKVASNNFQETLEQKIIEINKQKAISIQIQETLEQKNEEINIQKAISQKYQDSLLQQNEEINKYKAISIGIKEILEQKNEEIHKQKEFTDIIQQTLEQKNEEIHKQKEFTDQIQKALKTKSQEIVKQNEIANNIKKALELKNNEISKQNEKSKEINKELSIQNNNQEIISKIEVQIQNILIKSYNLKTKRKYFQALQQNLKKNTESNQQQDYQLKIQYHHNLSGCKIINFFKIKMERKQVQKAFQQLLNHSKNQRLIQSQDQIQKAKRVGTLFLSAQKLGVVINQLFQNQKSQAYNKIKFLSFQSKVSQTQNQCKQYYQQVLSQVNTTNRLKSQYSEGFLLFTQTIKKFNQRSLINVFKQFRFNQKEQDTKTKTLSRIILMIKKRQLKKKGFQAFKNIFKLSKTLKQLEKLAKKKQNLIKIRSFYKFKSQVKDIQLSLYIKNFTKNTQQVNDELDTMLFQQAESKSKQLDDLSISRISIQKSPQKSWILEKSPIPQRNRIEEQIQESYINPFQSINKTTLKQGNQNKTQQFQSMINETNQNLKQKLQVFYQQHKTELKKKESQYQNKIQEIQNININLEKERKAYQNENEQLTIKMESFVEKLLMLESSFDKNQEERIQGNNIQNALKQHIQTLQQKLKSQNEIINKKDAIINNKKREKKFEKIILALNKDKEELVQRLEMSFTGLKQIRVEYEKISEEKVNMHLAVEEYQQQLDIKQNEIINLEEEFNLMKQKLTKNNKQNEFERKYQAKAKELKKTQKTLDNSTKTQDKLQKCINQKAHKIQSLQKSGEQMAKDMLQMNKEQQSLERQIDRQKEGLQQKNNMNNKLKQKIEALNIQILDQEESFQEQLIQKQHSPSKINQILKEKAKQEREMGNMKDKVYQLQSILQKYEQGHNVNNQSLKILKSKNTEYLEKLQKQESKNKELVSQIGDLNRNKIDLMKQMSNLNEKAQKAHKKKKEYEKISKNFEQKITEYQVQMNIYAEVLKKMDRKCQNLSNNSILEKSQQQKQQKSVLSSNPNQEEISAIVKSIRQNLK